jgi:hypothetical protein
VTIASDSSSPVTGAFLPEYGGLTFTEISLNRPHVFVYDSPTTGDIKPGQGTIGPYNYTYNGDDRPIPVGGPLSLTHVWVWRAEVIYRSTDFSGDSALACAVEAYPTVDLIQGFIAPAGLQSAAFIVGANNAVNSNGNGYAYVAICLDPVLAAKHLFASLKGTSSGAVTTSITGLGFTPAIALARRFVGNSVTTGAIWRGPDHTGTDSSWSSLLASGNDVPSVGIRSLDADGMTVGTEIAPAGSDFHAWAFKGGSGGGGTGGGPGGGGFALIPTYLFPYPKGGPNAASPCSQIT